MCELAQYIKTPLTPGDEVNVKVGEVDIIKCEVLRVEYNYHGIEGLHKVLVKSFDPSDNTEFDNYSGKYYFNIVLQQIYL